MKRKVEGMNEGEKEARRKEGEEERRRNEKGKEKEKRKEKERSRKGVGEDELKLNKSNILEIFENLLVSKPISGNTCVSAAIVLCW